MSDVTAIRVALDGELEFIEVPATLNTREQEFRTAYFPMYPHRALAATDGAEPSSKGQNFLAGYILFELTGLHAPGYGDVVIRNIYPDPLEGMGVTCVKFNGPEIVSVQDICVPEIQDKMELMAGLWQHRLDTTKKFVAARARYNSTRYTPRRVNEIALEELHGALRTIVLGTKTLDELRAEYEELIPDEETASTVPGELLRTLYPHPFSQRALDITTGKSS